jgi:REP element-mobilizing transposase RayT
MDRVHSLHINDLWTINFLREKKTRLKEYDYSTDGYYFLTICLKDRNEFFSHINNATIKLTQFGIIVEDIISNLPKYYNVKVDEYVIMPDHIHAIFIIDNALTVSKNKNIKRNKSLSDIVSKFKSYATKKIREQLKSNEQFQWQKSFYDRIIRNEQELFSIRKYIIENQLKWDIEKNYPNNLEM